MDRFTGTRFGRYKVVEQLGQGGMAIVLKAFDEELERTVAIKVILQNERHTPEFLARFKREARTLARLSHPNIVTVLDYGEQDGLPFLVMEYIEDGSLATAVERPMHWSMAARLLAPIARALALAHRLGIIHRDVKPSNILLTETKEPLLSDFGIAKMIEMHETAELTAPGLGIGTPEYMAPEQSLGGEIDHRADIYSLGVVLYELVTGVRPYTADTPLGVLLKHHNAPLPLPSRYIPNLDKEVERFICKLMAKDAEQRFTEMDEVANLLVKISQGLPLGLINPQEGIGPAKQVTRRFNTAEIELPTIVENRSAPGNGKYIHRDHEDAIWLASPAPVGPFSAPIPPPPVPGTPNRTTRLAAILGGLGLLALLWIGGFLLPGLFAPKMITITGGQVSTPPVEFASVQGVSGLVEILSSDGTALRLAKGMRLMVGGPFRIRSTDGLAQLTLVDGSAMCIQPGTDIEFLSVSGQSQSAGVLTLSLMSGRLLFIDGEGQGSKMSIANPFPVTINSQGAIIGLEASSAGLGRLDLDCLLGSCSFESSPDRLDLLSPGHTWLEAAGLFSSPGVARTTLWANLCTELTGGLISGQPTATKSGLFRFFSQPRISATPTNSTTLSAKARLFPSTRRKLRPSPRTAAFTPTRDTPPQANDSFLPLAPTAPQPTLTWTQPAPATATPRPTATNTVRPSPTSTYLPTSTNTPWPTPTDTPWWPSATSTSAWSSPTPTDEWATETPTDAPALPPTDTPLPPPAETEIPPP